MAGVVRRAAKNVFVPLTVGGGIRNVDDFRVLLRAGADKISVNSAAIRDPGLITEAAAKFGSQCVVVAIDAKRADSGFPDGTPRYNIFVHGGRIDTGIDAVEWAKEAGRRGAGEILLTSMDTDGTKEGFDTGMLNAVCAVVGIPVIASGGGGSLRSFTELFQKTGADAALAASIFHYGEYTVSDVKRELECFDIPVRPVF
jgi:cyclase